MKQDRKKWDALVRAINQADRLQDAVTRASAELRHAYRHKSDWRLVARAIEILELATTTKETP